MAVGPFEVANALALGLITFASAGTLKGADADLDFFGVVVLATRLLALRYDGSLPAARTVS